MNKTETVNGPATKSVQPAGLPSWVVTAFDAPVAAMLSALTFYPDFSFNPLFNIYLLGGFVVFLLELVHLTEKKRHRIVAIVGASSAAAAGYVLVSWAKYWSAAASIIMEAIIVFTALGIAYFRRREIRKNYGRMKRWVFVALILITIFPAISFRDVGDKPLVVVSPSLTSVPILAPGGSDAFSGFIGSVYFSSWSVELTAHANASLSVYINNVTGTPLEIPFLEKGRPFSVSFRIQSSPLMTNGTYPVVFDYKWRDVSGTAYSSTTIIQVFIGSLATTIKGTPLNNAIPYFVVALIVGTAVVLATPLLLRRFRR